MTLTKNQWMIVGGVIIVILVWYFFMCKKCKKQTTTDGTKDGTKSESGFCGCGA